MAVDVTSELVIDRPLEEVASYVADPINAPEWYQNIESIEWETEPLLQPGSRMTFVARFLGRRLQYTYEIREYQPGARLVMSTAQGPFPMETTYTWTPASDQATKMTLRNRGEPAGFVRFTASMMAVAMQRANQKDMVNLKAILENK